MKVGVYTLGCKVNTYESEFIISLFKNRGYEIVDFNDDCDVYVINTCTVTNNSDRKDRKIINSVKDKGIVIVCGCFVESATDYDFDGVDVVIGNYNKSLIVDYLEEFIRTKKQIISKENIMTVPFEDMEINHVETKTRAFVKIQDGCENYCAYCIIPFVRGRCRSKEKDTVIREITTLVNNGYKEIVLTGIHTGNYGVDLGIKFSSLLEEILNIPGLKRLRISSIEITELDDKFFELLKNPILCNHLHIPLQSGSDNVLKLMNRKYDINKYKEIISKIRQIRPNINITTDLIVGFPTETKEDFEETKNNINDIKFGKIHVFPYSKRDGTLAATFKNIVKDSDKKERTKEMLDISSKLEYDYYKSFLNKKLDVIIEEVNETYSIGHSSNYIKVHVNEKLVQNKVYTVIIVNIKNNVVYGEIIS